MRRQQARKLGTSCGHASAAVPDYIRVEVERGLAVRARETASSDLRLLSDLPPGLILVMNSELDPRFNVIRVERP